jgi:hypothetical protein
MEQIKITEMISQSRNGFETKYKKIQIEAERAYFMKFTKEEQEYFIGRNMSHYFAPKINSKSKRITDSTTDMYFETDRYVQLGEYINSDPKVIEKWQNAIDMSTARIDLYDMFLPIFQKAPYSIISAAKVYWAEDAPVIEDINPEDIWFDPSAVSKADTRYVVHQIYLTKEDIDALTKRKIFKRVDYKFEESKVCERFKLHEVYFLEKGVWKVSTVFNDTVFLRENIELDDGLPFVWGGMLYQPKEVDEENYIANYYEPAINSIIQLQHELNKTRNSVLDGVRQQLFPKTILPLAAGVSRLDIETIGKPIYTNGQYTVQVAPQPNMTGVFELMSVIDNDASEASGISPQQNGISTARKETATMVSIMNNEGNTRLQGYLRTFNKTFFEQIFAKIALLVWKYADSMFFWGINRKEIPSHSISVNAAIGALNKEVQKNALLQANMALTEYFKMCASVGDMRRMSQAINGCEYVLKKLLPIYGLKNIPSILGDEDGTIGQGSGGIPSQQNKQGAGGGIAGGTLQQQALPINGEANV